MTATGDKEARELIAAGVTTMWRLGGQVSASKFQAVDKETGELPTQYKVIQTGRYKGFWVSDIGQVMTKKGHIISSIHTNNAGYNVVSFRLNGKITTTTIARLVASAWLPNPEGLTDVVRYNGNKIDDRATNLYWDRHTSGVNSKAVKVSAIDAKTGDIVRDFASINDAAKSCKTSNTAIKGALVFHNAVNGYKFIYTISIGKAEELLHK